MPCLTSQGLSYCGNFVVTADRLLSLVTDYEPAISATVGLLTLTAMAWGLVQFALLPLLRWRAQAATSPGDSPAASFRFWASMIDRGLGPGADLAEQVDVRTFNIITIFVSIATLTWLVATLLSDGVLILSVVNFLVFVIAITAYNLHAAGYRLQAKWLFIGDVVFFWGVSIVLMGGGAGLEYFLGGLLTVPLLLFRDEQRRQIYCACAVIILALPLALLLDASLQFEIPAAYEHIRLPFYYVNAVVLAALVFLILDNYNRSADESFRQLEDQKQKSEELIHRIVPAYIAEKILGRSSTVADWHSEASVLFATIHGFEQLYRRVSAVQLVELLGKVFGEFDELVNGRRVEKINTLGTNYVAVTGIGPGGVSHDELAEVAIGMREIITRFSDTVRHPFSLRVGISTGDVVSGVIGDSRPSFDVWGRTVEIANAMRGSALNNTIVVNEAAYWRLRDRFDFEQCDLGGEPTYLLLGERGTVTSPR